MTTTAPAPGLDIRRGVDRSRTELPWLDSKHSFSFGLGNDPSNVHHGVLLVNNDDTVRAGTGFGTHPHQDMEIVTWVLTGSLVHQDSEGHSGVIYPGLAQRMSAGTGILHSEKNDSWRLSGGPAHSEPVRFVQMWVAPDEAGITPSYEQMEVDEELLSGGLLPVASGMARHDGRRAIRINNRHAALHVARLQVGEPRRTAGRAVPSSLRGGRRADPRRSWAPHDRGRRPILGHGGTSGRGYRGGC